MSKIAPVRESTSSKRVNAAIALVATSAGAFIGAVQTAAITVLQHAEAFGDCTGAARLMDAMPKSTRRALLQTFFQRYSPISVIVKDGKALAKFRKDDNKDFNIFNVEGAKANPWHSIPEADKEPELKTAEDFKAGLDRFLTYWKKVTDAGDTTKVNERDLPAIKQMVANLQAANVNSAAAKAA